jgi:hypothetical protein
VFSFIPIDSESNDTVGMGIVDITHPSENRCVVPRAAALTDLINATETHGRSLAKAISWRATGSLDTFIVAVLITGKLESRRKRCIRRDHDEDAHLLFP